MINEDSKVNMIKQQLRTGDVLNEDVLGLFDKVCRADFVPTGMHAFAYSDMQIPLMHGQRMMTPLEEGKILQALNLQGNESILEIGTGTGFLTALLALMGKNVISIDYYADFTKMAAQNLAKSGINNVELITGDAYSGWMESAPYDVIVFTGAIEQVTDGLKLQVMPGGKLFVIVGNEPIMQGQLHSLDHQDNWQHELLFETSIPPLINKLKPRTFVF